MDEQFTITEAVVVDDGLITMTGATEDALKLAGTSTTVLDLGGRTVMPGFVDPHTHLLQAPAPDLVAMAAGRDQLLSWGVTTAGMPSVLPNQVEAFEQMNATGNLILRTHIYLAYNSVCGERDFGDFYLSRDFSRDPDARFAIAGVKIFTDGGVCDAPATSFEYPETVPDGLKDGGWVGNGSLFVSPEEVASVVNEVDAAGGQTVIHAIGDTAISTALSGLSLAGDLENTHQIHHNSMSTLIDPEMLTLYGDTNQTPVVFLVRWANACDPGRASLWGSILPEPALGTLEDSTAIATANPGIRISWHGDAPSLPGSPLEQLFTTVTAGYTQDGEICYPEVWTDIPTVGVEQALAMLTINAAAAMGFEDSFGSIEVGKKGDLVVTSEDPLDVDHEVGLAKNFAVTTIVDGEIEYCIESFCDEPAEPIAAPDGVCWSMTTEVEASIQSWWTADADGTDLISDNTGVLLGNTRITSGYVGGAFELSDGAVALSSQPDLVEGFTVEGWVWLDQTGFDGYRTIFNNNQMFLRKDSSSEGNLFSIFVNLEDDTVEPRAQASVMVTPETWTHVAGTWDGSTLTVYVNGQPGQPADRSGSLVTTTAEARIGSGEQLDVTGGEFAGFIDELTIYDRSLTQSEIGAIHDALNGGKCRG